MASNMFAFSNVLRFKEISYKNLDYRLLLYICHPLCCLHFNSSPKRMAANCLLRQFHVILIVFFSCILFWMLRLLVTHWIKIFCGWPFWLGRVINLLDWIGWETGNFFSLKFLLYPKTGWVWLTTLCVDCFRPSAVTRMKQTKHTQESLLQKTCFRLVVSWKYWLSFFKEPFMFRQRSIFSSGFANEFRKSVPISNNCISNM